MPKYLAEIRYGAEAAKGVNREGGSSRREAAARLIEGLGGKMEAFYFAYGEVDVYCICDMPDESRALALSIAVNQTGVMSCRLTVLIPPEVLDAAAKVEASFRPPGQ
jgi:uncharacterized protein with GYD domain